MQFGNFSRPVLKALESELSLSFSLTNEDLPKIARGHSLLIIIALKSEIVPKRPMLPSVYIGWEPIQSILNKASCSRPCPSASAPFAASPCHLGVIILHSLKRATGTWTDISQTAKELDHTFSRTVSSRDHVKRASQLFAAVKSYLLKIQVFVQFLRGVCRNYHLVAIVVTYSTV